MTDLEAVGGPAALARIVETFVRRMAADFVVGFHFQGKDLERVALRETELAEAHLGGSRGYGGRSLGEVHAPLRIHQGHFRRRLHLLRATLREHGVPEPVVERWVAHDAALEPVVASTDDCLLPDGGGPRGGSPPPSGTGGRNLTGR